MEHYNMTIRPNRSDTRVTKETEARIEEETRQCFDGIAQRRHTKPERSDYSSTPYLDAFSETNGLIPEFVEFQRLETASKQTVSNGRSKVQEDFVETNYYNDLNCVDKQHHTTGTGFIKMEKTNGKSFVISTLPMVDHHDSCKGNPATNEWIPSVPDSVSFVSDKPSRSDN